MTNNCAWSLTTYPANPGEYSFSVDRLSVTPLTGTQGVVVTTQGLTSGKYIAAVQFTQGTFNIGLFDSGSIGGTPPAIGLVYGTGTGQIYYSPSGGGYSSVASLGSAVNGDWIVIKFNVTTQLAWFALVHSGTAGNWNGSGTADPETGIGGISFAALGTTYFGNWFYSPSSSGPAVLNSGGSTYPGAITNGTYSNLPSGVNDTALVITQVLAVLNGITTISWQAFNYPVGDGLQYQFDDSGLWLGALTPNAMYNQLGSSGTFLTLNSFVDYDRHVVMIRQQTETTDVTPDYSFIAFIPGTAPTQIKATVAGAPGLYHTYPLITSSNVIDITFSFYPIVQDGLFGSGSCGIDFYNASGQTLLVLTPAISNSYNGGSFSAGPAGTQQTGTFGSGDTITASGSCSLSISGGNLNGDYSLAYNTASGTGTLSAVGVRFETGSTDSVMTSLTINQTGTRGTNEYLLNISTPPSPPETLTITGASCTAGSTLSITGSSWYGPPASVDISHDNGATWLADGSYSTSAGTIAVPYSTSSQDTLSAGTYLLYTRDSISHVQSNVWTLTVAGTLTAAARVSQSVRQMWVAPNQTSRIGLFQTNVLPSPTDTYIEFGTQMAWQYQTALLPDNQQQRNNAMVITTLDLAFVGAAPVVNTQFLDSGGTVLQQAAIVPGGAFSVWDGTPAQSTWGVSPWGGTLQPLSPYQIPWAAPLAFKQGKFNATGMSYAGFKIGTVYLEYQILGYVSQVLSGRT